MPHGLWSDSIWVLNGLTFFVTPHFLLPPHPKVSWWSGAVRISGGGVKNKQYKVRVRGLHSRGPWCKLPQHRDLCPDQNAPVPFCWPPCSQSHCPEQQEHPANPELAQCCREVNTLCVWSIDLFSLYLQICDLWSPGMNLHEFDGVRQHTQP